MWPDTTLDQTARHEAGHAVARVILGVPFEYVRVTLGDSRVVSGQVGQADWLPILPADYTVSDAKAAKFDMRHADALTAFCVSAAAGPISQMRYEERKPTQTLDGFGKFGGPADANYVEGYQLVIAAQNNDAVSAIIAEKDLRVRSVLTHALALVDDNRAWIERVGAALEERQTLSQSEVADLADG